MSIRKRKWKSGSEIRAAWIVDYSDLKGKRRQLTFRTKKEADKQWRKISADLLNGSHTPASAGGTIAEAGELWIRRAKIEGLERSTYQEYERVFRIHIEPRIGDTKLAYFDRIAVEHFKDSLLEELPVKTAHRAFSYVKLLLKVAKRKGLISTDPSEDISIVLPSRYNDRPEIFNKYEINLFLTTAERISARHAAFAYLFFFVGLRASEGRGLAWKQIDLENGLLTVSQRADRWGIIGVPKSRSSFRTVSLTPSCIEAVRRWREVSDGEGEGLVFPGSSGQPLTYSQLVKQIYDPIMFAADLIVEEDGRRKHLRSLHAMRHTTASILIEAGCSAKRVQVHMGHSSIQITFDLYAHLIDLQQSAAEMMLSVERSVLNRRPTTVPRP